MGSLPRYLFCMMVFLPLLAGCQTTKDVNRIIGDQDRNAVAEATDAGSPTAPPTLSNAPVRGRPVVAVQGPTQRAPQLYPGSGVLASPPTEARTDAFANAQGDIFLTFADAPVAEVIKVVLGEILGVNYAIDPRVQGMISMETTRPLARDAVLPVLEQTLATQGIALVEGAAGVYRILPLESASPDAAGPSGGAYGGFRTRIIALDHIGAQEMRDLLQPFVPPGRQVTADGQRNLLIAVGNSADLQRWSDLIDTFDVDWLAGMSFGIFPVRYTDARTMAADLEAVFSGSGAGGPMAGVLQIVPIERMNALLVATKRPEYLDRVGDWINRLDWADVRAGKRLYVYHVENRRAGDLAPLLSDIFSAHPGADRASPVPEADAGPALVPLGQAEEPGPDAEMEPAPAADRPARASGVAIRDDGAIRVIADEKLNALLILASPSDYRLVQSALDRLDVVPLQVLIEATILEVRLNDELQFGVQWFYEDGHNSFNFARDAAPFAGGVTGAGFSYFFTAKNLRATVNALDSITDVKVVSSPRLMVLDNETARLQVGDQVPVATQSSRDITNPDAPIVNSIQLLDTGVILEVTPRVNANGLVILDILQEVSDAVTTESSGIDSPTIQKRNVKSSIAIQGGETVALGGLIRDTDNRTESGIPVLMDIPLVGTVFRNTNDAQRRTELLVLLTPRVVRDSNDARAVTEELRRKLPALRQLENGKTPGQ